MTDSNKNCYSVEETHEGHPNFTLATTHKTEMAYSHGSFHPKIWVMEFEDSLRLLIGSANLYMGDWGFWSNNFWYRDFNPKSRPSNSTLNKGSMMDMIFGNK